MKWDAVMNGPVRKAAKTFTAFKVEVRRLLQKSRHAAARHVSGVKEMRGHLTPLELTETEPHPCQSVQGEGWDPCVWAHSLHDEVECCNE